MKQRFSGSHASLCQQGVLVRRFKFELISWILKKTDFFGVLLYNGNSLQ